MNHGGAIECGDGICSPTETDAMCPGDCMGGNMVGDNNTSSNGATCGDGARD